MNMKRRGFLAAGGAAGAAAVWPSQAGAQDSPLAPLAANAERVLVIGAGMAGLAAAKKLREGGKQVVVLEARTRIGGRIHTHTGWSDARVDLGATWIHGDSDSNPLAVQARSIGARLATTSYTSYETFDSDGTLLDSAARSQVKKLQTALEKTLAAAQDAATDQSVRDAARSGLGYATRSEADKKRIDFLINSTIEHEYAGEATKLSTYWYDNMAEYAGNDALFLDGFKVLLDALASGLDIRFGQVVTRIAHDSTGVTVSTTSGSFTASRVVVTLPLGVLQSGAVTFSPALPSAKQTAISRLGMGVYNKCYLRFPHAFWNTQVDWLEYIPERAYYGQWAEWVSFVRPTGQPILLGFNAAAFGKTIESWSDQEIVADAMDTLRTMYGDDIPAPTSWAITRWASDPYARGSYSCNLVGSTPAMRGNLAANVARRLYFAGEATEKTHFATAHGAYLSGQRAASEILNG